MRHPRESDLALLAGGDAGPILRFSLERHLRHCAQCRETLEQYEELRAETAEFDVPPVNWSAMANEMRANIHLGLEAGACVRSAAPARVWNPRLVLALASLLLLIGSSFFLNESRTRTVPALEASAPVLESTGSGIEFRSGEHSLMLLSGHGAAAGQTVSARGEIRARYIDGETGSVTINNVYLQ